MLYQLTADQAESFDPTTAGWQADVLIRLSEFPEVEGRAMVWQRDAYMRESERLVIEWDRNWTILALARNGRWVKQLDWELLQILLRDSYLHVNVKVTNAPGYADFAGELLYDSEFFSKVVVSFVSEGVQDLAAVPRSCVEAI